MSTRAQKIARLANKEYRDAFVGSQINVGLPFQIRALREKRGWKQSDLAERAEMLQPRISAMERPGGAKFNLETLRRLAAAFDVALEVRFVPFSDLVDWSERFNPDTFSVPSFDDDAALMERKAARHKAHALSPLMVQRLSLFGTNPEAGTLPTMERFPRSAPNQGSSSHLSQSIGVAAQAKGIRVVRPPARQLPLDLSPKLESAAQVMERKYA